MEAVTEPPKLYGPHAPVIVLRTSDYYACVPDNLKEPSDLTRDPFRVGSDLITTITEPRQIYKIIYIKI